MLKLHFNSSGIHCLSIKLDFALARKISLLKSFAQFILNCERSSRTDIFGWLQFKRNQANYISTTNRTHDNVACWDSCHEEQLVKFSCQLPCTLICMTSTVEPGAAYMTSFSRVSHEFLTHWHRLRDIQRGNTRQIVSRRYIQSIYYRKLY
jgi:hypothetical protein